MNCRLRKSFLMPDGKLCCVFRYASLWLTNILWAVQSFMDKVKELEKKKDEEIKADKQKLVDELEILKHLAKQCDLYLVAKVDTDKEAEQIEKICEDIQLYECGLNKYVCFENMFNCVNISTESTILFNC